MGFQMLPQTPRPGTATNMLTDVTDQDITGTSHAMHEYVLRFNLIWTSFKSFSQTEIAVGGYCCSKKSTFLFLLKPIKSQCLIYDRLSITGCHVDAKMPPPEEHKLNSEGTEYSPYEKEEIFEQDGTVEDIIAVDYKST